MWWLFSNKKKRYDSDTHSFHLLGKIKTIEDSLKNSFFNIKRDITKINGYLYHHDTSIEHLKTRISYLESHVRDLKSEKPIKLIKETIEKEQIQEENFIPKENLKQNLPIKWEDLTNIQQNIFLRLGLLHIESGQRRIAMKHLAEELYPEKEYNDVRSMISDYINLLNEYGLIKKSRKGRQIFVSITERGSIFYDKTKRKKLLEVINRHKE